MLALLLGPSVGVLAPKGMVVVLAGVALLAVCDAGTRRALVAAAAGYRRRLSNGALLGLAGLAWLAISATVADTMGAGPPIALQLLGLAVLAAVARRSFATADPGLRPAALIGLALGAVLQVGEGVSGNFLHRLAAVPPPDGWHLDLLNIGATNLVVFGCAAAGLLAAQRGHLAGFGLLAAVAALTVAFDSLAAVLAGGIAAVAYGLAVRWQGPVRAALRWGAIGTVVVMPVLVRGLGHLPPAAMDLLPASAVHRVLIWNYTLDRIGERPVLGWGLNSARHLGHGQTVEVRGKTVDALPLHPHNAVLQILIEAGLPGLAVLVWAIVWVTRPPPREPASEPARLALAAAAGTIGLTAYGLWQMHWLSSLIVAAFAVSAVRRPETVPAPSDPGS